jgi:hypothetical protein
MFRFADVDPTTLWTGANPIKFTRQLSKYGTSTTGMLAIEVHEDPDGRLMIVDGVTRATRVAKFLPGVLVQVKIVGREPRSVAKYPTVRDRLP